MARPDHIVKGLVRSEFVVTMKSAETWQGILIAADPSTLELSNAHSVSSDGTRTAADGHIYLPRTDVAYMQRA